MSEGDKCPFNGSECRKKCALYNFSEGVCAISSIAESLKTISNSINVDDGGIVIKIKEKEDLR